MNLAAPYYLYRPSQIVRRLFHRKPPVHLPWGVSIDCDPNEAIGKALVHNGIYDHAVTEFLWRLTDRGDICIDAGANIGVMTSVLAHRSGPGGLVIAFEPNPGVSARLAKNVARWTTGAVIDVRTQALSSVVGIGTMTTPAHFAENNGTARIDASASVTGVPVRLVTLDHALSGNTRIGVMKIDIEEHELDAFTGAAHTLRAGQIRDIVYEDVTGYPSPVSRLLEGHGYSIFAVREATHWPVLAPASTPIPEHSAPSYLATRDPARATQRLKGRGWRCLHG